MARDRSPDAVPTPLEVAVGDVLRALPELPTARAYEVADRVGRTEAGFGTFMELLRDGVGKAVRDVVRGRASGEQQRLVGTRPLAEWGDLWHALARLQDETERFNLDKRHAIVSGLESLKP